MAALLDPRAVARFRRNRGARFGLVLVFLAMAAALFAPLLSPHDPNMPFKSRTLTTQGGPIGPTWEFPLGADVVGRCELSRLLHGARVSLTVAFAATALIVLVGTFTSVNKEGKTEGVREAYRVCLALADLKSGKIISKGVARAKPEGVNTTPTQYFKDSPTWAPDQATEGYIKTCQGTKAGDPINPAYVDRILTAALVSEAIDAYNNRQYREALDLYQSALHSPGGEQLRVYNGLYLSNWKLGHRDEATQAFGKVVDYGLVNKRLAVKFLFKPGSTDFWADRRVTGPYPIWLEQIAERTSQYQGCLEIVGHTSRTGPEPINERLSLLRAERIKQKLDRDVPALKTRTIANGVGSKENLIGTGPDDARDALDRRVEFKVVGCRAPG